MLHFIENWLRENLIASEALIIYRLKKTSGDVGSIRVDFVSSYGEGQIFAWEDGRLDALIFQSDGEETVSARFVLTDDYQDFTASLLGLIVAQLGQSESGITL